MNKSGCIFTVLLVLVFAIGSIGCNQGIKAPESSKDAMEMIMKILPANFNSVGLVNLKAGSEDDSRPDIHEAIKEVMGYGDFIDDVAYISIRERPYMTILIIDSNKNKRSKSFAQITKPQDSNAYKAYEYKGVRVWAKKGEETKTIEAVFNNIRILGQYDEVKACIDVLVDGEPSLYQSDELREILDQLPNGHSLSIGYWDWDLGITEEDYGAEIAELYEGIIAMGTSTMHDGEQFVETTIFLKQDGQLIENVEYRDN